MFVGRHTIAVVLIVTSLFAIVSPSENKNEQKPSVTAKHSQNPISDISNAEVSPHDSIRPVIRIASTGPEKTVDSDGENGDKLLKRDAKMTKRFKQMSVRCVKDRYGMCKKIKHPSNFVIRGKTHNSDTTFGYGYKGIPIVIKTKNGLKIYSAKKGDQIMKQTMGIQQYNVISSDNDIRTSETKSNLNRERLNNESQNWMASGSADKPIAKVTDETKNKIIGKTMTYTGNPETTKDGGERHAIDMAKAEPIPRNKSGNQDAKGTNNPTRKHPLTTDNRDTKSSNVAHEAVTVKTDKKKPNTHPVSASHLERKQLIAEEKPNPVVTKTMNNGPRDNVNRESKTKHPSINSDTTDKKVNKPKSTLSTQRFGKASNPPHTANVHDYRFGLPRVLTHNYMGHFFNRLTDLYHDFPMRKPPPHGRDDKRPIKHKPRIVHSKVILDLHGRPLGRVYHYESPDHKFAITKGRYNYVNESPLGHISRNESARVAMPRVPFYVDRLWPGASHPFSWWRQAYNNKHQRLMDIQRKMRAKMYAARHDYPPSHAMQFRHDIPLRHNLHVLPGAQVKLNTPSRQDKLPPATAKFSVHHGDLISHDTPTVNRHKRANETAKKDAKPALGADDSAKVTTEKTAPTKPIATTKGKATTAAPITTVVSGGEKSNGSKRELGEVQRPAPVANLTLSGVPAMWHGQILTLSTILSIAAGVIVCCCIIAALTTCLCLWKYPSLGLGAGHKPGLSSASEERMKLIGPVGSCYHARLEGIDTQPTISMHDLAQKVENVRIRQTDGECCPVYQCEREPPYVIRADEISNPDREREKFLVEQQMRERDIREGYETFSEYNTGPRRVQANSGQRPLSGPLSGPVPHGTPGSIAHGGPVPHNVPMGQSGRVSMNQAGGVPGPYSAGANRAAMSMGEGQNPR